MRRRKRSLWSSQCLRSTKTTSFGIVDGVGASNIVTVTFQVTQSEEIARLVVKELV